MTRIDRRPVLFRLSRHARFRPLPLVLAVAVALTVCAIGGSQSSRAPAPAADLSQFTPGNIISDREFFSGSAMSAADVQSFLVTRNPRCVAGPDGSPCLQNFVQDTAAMPSDAQCSGYVAGARESAATIISKIAVSCNVNPKVLLVTLQKERGLVTATGSQLDSSDYRITMGYGCPDTGPCDPSKFGFQNQIFHAAWQFQYYAHHPDNYAYRAGHTVNILYNPATSCGSSPVYIQNQATAGLYIYTPYQPNAAALRGGSDGCSAFGNLNFWRYYTDWFVSTQNDAVIAASPRGVVEAVTVTPTGFAASGWAYDPDAPDAPLNVRATVDGTTVATVSANVTRQDVAAAFGVGNSHGYGITGLLGYGTHAVCMVADNLAGLGGPVQLGCTQLTFTDRAPVAAIDTFAEQADGSAILSGWAFDADGRPAQVRVTDNGTPTTYDTAVARPDVQAAFPAAASLPNSGFSVTIGLAGGPHAVCVSAVDLVAPGNDWQMTCKTFAYQAPFGVVDAVSQTATGDLRINGWAIDPSLPTTPVEVHVYVDGKWQKAFTAGESRPDVGQAYPGTGPAHGYEAVVPVASGAHQVCTYAINVGAGGPNPQLGCRGVTVKYTPPGGVLEEATPIGDNKVVMSGWVVDPDAPAVPTSVHFYVDGQWFAAVDASDLRPDVAAVYPSYGPAHGFGAQLTLSPGRHQICTYAMNLGLPGRNPLLNCSTLTVFDRAPIGAVDAAVTGAGQVTVNGWTFDPDLPVQSLTVQVSVDGVVQKSDTANTTRPDIGQGFPSAGAAHGYIVTVPIAAGTHDVCVSAVGTAAGATPTQLRCARVTG